MKITQELDFITMANGGIQAHGSVARRMLEGNFDLTALRQSKTDKDGKRLHVNALLGYDEWKELDDKIVPAFRQRLTGIAELKSRGLVKNMGGRGFAKSVLQYQRIGDFSPAELTMDMRRRTQMDVVENDLGLLPLPIIRKDYEIEARLLAESRNTPGFALDTLSAERAARVCAELDEDLLFNGYNSFTYAGATLYGLTDFPDRNIGTLIAPWDTLGQVGGATGASILADILAMMAQARADNRHGPYGIFIPNTYEGVLGEDYSTNYSGTISTRLMAIPGLAFVRVADRLDDGNVVLVQLDTETVRIVEGMPLTNVQWDEGGEAEFHFRVMLIDVPQFFSDMNHNCGIVHYTE